MRQFRRRSLGTRLRTLHGGHEIGMRLGTRTQRQVGRDSNGETTTAESKRPWHVRAMARGHILRVDDSAAVIDRRTEQEFEIR